MPDTKDSNGVASSPIPDDVWISDDNKLPRISPSNKPSTFRKVCEVVGSFDQARRQVLRGMRIELLEIDADCFKVSNGRL